MLRCGLLGRKLGHSYSPQIHHELFSYEYKLYEKEPEELESFLKSGTFDGLNVTIPYKKAVMPLLDEISPEAAAIGSVNTIVNRAGKLTGYNTDAFGFTWLLQKSGVALSDVTLLVHKFNNTVCQTENCILSYLYSHKNIDSKIYCCQRRT